jgi:regulator of sigma E protease
LDPNANASSEPVNAPLDNQPKPPEDPVGEAGQSDRAAEVSALKAWFKENLVSLLISVIAVALVCKFLDPIDTLKVVIGLGLVIFIHELGHFLAAKWCDVHVKTFSIGFGPAVPFCSYKWGETTYMVGIIPLGGYVAMVGEGDNAGEDDAEEDPRSFRHKTVGQRMLIISSGVVMNIILGMACFVGAYLHGVREEPATVGAVISGGAAWQSGLRSDDKIIRIESRENPSFNDLRPLVMRTRKGESVSLLIERSGVPRFEVNVEPLREEGTYFPTLGIAAQYRPALLSIKKQGFHPTLPGSAASHANPPFEPGDQIIGMTDPKHPEAITPLKPDAQDVAPGQDIDDYYLRMAKLAGQPITFRVLRKNEGKETADITVAPAYRADLGMRMRMGEVVALRRKGPAEEAGLAARTDGPPATTGDRIKLVKLPEADGKETWFTTGDEKDQATITVHKLDPILLPLELKKWSERHAGKPALQLKLIVLRTVGHKDNVPVELTLNYDFAYQNDRQSITLPNSPVPIGGLGLAYWVEAVVDDVTAGGPAAEATTAPGEPPTGWYHRLARLFGLEERKTTPGGEPMPLHPGDLVTAVRLKAQDDAGNVQVGEWDEVKAYQWASVEAAFQKSHPYDIDLRVKRGEDVLEVTVKGREDKNWPTENRGLIFQQDFTTQKAADMGDALNLGAQRTVRFIRLVYMNLYSMVFGRVSAKTMSGPLSIATASYRLAGEDLWQFLLFLGMISVNLAVVNFLPVPVLDGGHMVFLILEKILGRPVPERLFAVAMYTGLFLILSLMVFVIFLDVQRLF